MCKKHFSPSQKLKQFLLSRRKRRRKQRSALPLAALRFLV